MNNSFLDSLNWKIIEPISGDASTRQYFRAVKDGKIAILMDCSAEPDNKIREFIKIAKWLVSVKLKAPQIYETDEDSGFLLLEDFGDVSFRKAIESGGERLLYYVLATDVLKHIGMVNCDIALLKYRDSRIHQGRRRVIDWYAPTIKGEKNPDGWAEEYIKTWDGIEKSLPPCKQGFVHADYHLENLMVLPEGEGLAHCGILDFQDGMIGPLPYDLANLLEDARTDVPADTKTAMLAYYTADLNGPEEVEAFEAWYRVLATQFHCRVIGQFIKLALAGKPQYLQHIPRLEAYIKAALKDPMLKPLKAFFSDIKLDFQGANGLNARVNKEHIRSDAF